MQREGELNRRLRLRLRDRLDRRVPVGLVRPQQVEHGDDDVDRCDGRARRHPGVAVEDAVPLPGCIAKRGNHLAESRLRVVGQHDGDGALLDRLDGFAVRRRRIGVAAVRRVPGR